MAPPCCAAARLSVGPLAGRAGVRAHTPLRRAFASPAVCVLPRGRGACGSRANRARRHAAAAAASDPPEPDSAVERDAAYELAAGLWELSADDDGDEEEAQTALETALAGITSTASARAALEGPGGPGLAAVLARLSESTRVPESLLPGLLKLPSTAGSYEAVEDAARGLLSWRTSLQRGLMPSADAEWPRDAVFREALLDAMGSLDMARFTRRHPALLDTLLANVLDVLAAYETQKKDVVGPDGADGDQEQRDGEQTQSQQDATGADGAEAQDGEENQEQQDGSGGGGGGGSAKAKGGDESSSTDAADAAAEAAEFRMDGSEQQAKAEDAAAEAVREAVQDANAELAQRLADEFKKAWDPVVDKLDAAAKAFEGFDLDDLSDGPRGFDASAGVWQATGWRELDALRRKLEKLRELRDLVRNLGRGGGRGPLRRAPRQEASRGAPQGVVRSPVAPEETRGLTRSDDLGRMLPSEATLLALARPSADGTRAGVPAAKLLHFARRAERTLLSYERVGWADDPARTRSGMEVRPAAECGPILLCLDTSGSMMGARETVAKALALECMRQARTQRRGCYVYLFSGPGDCKEFQLALTAKGMGDMLDFISGSFHGGTDVDEPLRRCLTRAREAEWSNADVLLVTDGEIPAPDPALLGALEAMRTETGLIVHGLLVGDSASDAMTTLCANITTFRAWDAVR